MSKSLLGWRFPSNPSGPPPQVPDDFDSFERAVAALDRADPLYQPGPYWERHRERLIHYLRDHGLRDYRLGNATKKDPKYILARFGATDLPVPPPPNLEPKAWNADRYKLAEAYGVLRGAKPLDDLSVSRAGNSGDAFAVNGNTYTSFALNFYIRYAYVCQFVNFDEIDTIVEIGPGSGLQTEILHKLHPHLRSYLFDIPPQSYICGQFLKTVFPGKVLTLSDTLDAQKIPSIDRGQIAVMNSWQVPLSEGLDIDLFWNSASFNEMEPSLVENYLRFISPTCRNFYLMSIMEGSNVGIEDYCRFLSPRTPQRLEPVVFADGGLSPQYRNSFWSSQ